MLGDLDVVVKEYVKQLRTAGGVISTAVVMAAARGIVLSKNRALLQEYGGHIAIEKSWARSMLIRMNFVKRKGTNSAKLPLSDFEKVKSDFLERVKTCVLENQIVPQMVINWDQTAVRLVPYSDWKSKEAIILDYNYLSPEVNMVVIGSQVPQECPAGMGRGGAPGLIGLLDPRDLMPHPWMAGLLLHTRLTDVLRLFQWVYYMYICR